MGYVSNKTSLVTALTNAGYTEINNALSLDDETTLSEFDNHYILTPLGADTEMNTGTNLMHSDLLRLEVGYIAHATSKSINQQRDIDFDNFRDLIDVIALLSLFRGLNGQTWTFERLPESNHKFKGTVEFYWGAISC